MRLGLDLDNTLIDYSQSVREYTQRVDNDIVARNICDLRNALKSDDAKWQAAQSWIYSEGLQFAKPYFGAREVLRKVASDGNEVFIVSHKTEYSSDLYGKRHLRIPAINWLKSNLGVNDTSFGTKVFFESNRNSKISRIDSLKLDAFVDDLIEVLIDTRFPKRTERVLFDPYFKSKNKEVVIVNTLSDLLVLGC